MSVELAYDPLFHINLFIWLCWPQPSGLEVRPVFYEAGYSLYRISFGLLLDTRHVQRLNQAQVLFKERPEPDFLLRNDSRKVLVPLECKVSGFGPDADDRKHSSVQALSLLCQTGEALAQHLGFTDPLNWQAHLLFAVSKNGEDPTQGSIATLQDRLTSLHLPSLDCSVIGIIEREDGVFLRLARGAKPIIGVIEVPDSEIRVIHLQPGDEARLLYIIPWDPSIGPADAYGQRVFEERVRSALLSLVVGGIRTRTTVVSFDEVLGSTFPVWEQWKRSEPARAVRNEVRRYATGLLRQLQRKGLPLRITTTSIEIGPVLRPDIRRIQREAQGLISRTARGHDAVQLDFTAISEDWNFG